MNSILWMVFVACLAHQATADYKIKVAALGSLTDAIEVTRDDPKKGDLRITNNEERDGSTFKAIITQDTWVEQGRIEGNVCDVDEKTPAGTVAKMFHLAVGVDDCPFPKGDLEVIKEFQIEGNVFDQYIDENFGDLSIEAKVYGKNNNGTRHDVYWNFDVIELEEPENDEAEPEKEQEA